MRNLKVLSLQFKGALDRPLLSDLMAWLLVEISDHGSDHEELPEKPFALSSFTLDLLMDTYTTSYLEFQALSSSLANETRFPMLAHVSISFKFVVVEADEEAMV